jgi:hypothetical protein
MYTLFRSLIYLHVACGVVGLVAFWVPVASRKGGVAHRQWGRLFTYTMLVAGASAVGMSIVTLSAPLETHPHLVSRFDADFIRNVFGWMMLGLATLTVNLVWYGWLCVQNRRRHEQNLEWRNLTLQGLLVVASLICAWRAIAAAQPLMFGMTAIGLATAGTNLWFLFKPRRGPDDWLLEHIKALVGAGISVYTEFLAVGAVRTLPQLALHPGLWAVPLVVGLALILTHQRRVRRSRLVLATR